MGYSYGHASLFLSPAGELMVTKKFTINTKIANTKTITGGHTGTRRPKNALVEATMNITFDVALDDPLRPNFLAMLKSGRKLVFTVSDPVFDGVYEMDLDELGGDDDYQGEVSYTLACSGYKVA